MTAATLAPAPTRTPVDARAHEAVLDVVIPVYDEEADLARCVRRLHAHLLREFPYPFRITVADNASTDRTLAVAHELAHDLPCVRVVHLPQKGRGRALHAVWSTSDAPVLAYMDVDLSTDLDGLLPLVAPLISGHSDIAIGSRLARGARVVRGPKREFISRCYNLLLLAERAGLRIHEVPVDWVDDPDSKVDIVATATADLKGVARVLGGLASGRIPVAQVRARLGRSPVAA